ncbi:hypothetical protein JQC91_00500 [Jannaschia sp. Os4]|uniref:hypothetical protein n=1 Tax=Jannaschia sp. Os4 TaxID=2807617 RepID=UPI0019397FB4|nr:hypothetical protein [Jannaschia sp. Os4]MBM2574770.1 hypothetical protein [Jannaschia sp. Os4]
MLARPLAILVLAALPARAEPDVTRSGSDCDCVTASGFAVAQGQTTCLAIGRRSFVALCAMSQNVPVFRDTGEACVTG